MAAPTEPFADVLTALVRMLADVLRLKPEKVDPEQTFQTFGFDSLLAVEYAATVNAHYGTSVKAAVLVDHPTPLAFARYMMRELGPAGTTQPAADTPPAPAPFAAAMRPAPVAPAPVAPQTSPASPVLDVLREEVARILCCDPWDIDSTASFPVLGLDSMLSAEFVAVVNRMYGLRERAVTLYDHPNLHSLASYINGLLPAAAVPSSAAPATGPGPMPLEDLLDAVRDGRVTVDQALAVLPRRV
ncbi:hypothetical protein BIV23_09960 [Streptomyces monashensis]|uniref:Carrier domain-containing protein n=2 Tax=Streptomyces monashensis TaxID=1678012 RepID=A0A1S2QK54_9ACTN|nr:hypothetical protein BIV23_09960 [Streptomyces monashensis]